MGCREIKFRAWDKESNVYYSDCNWLSFCPNGIRFMSVVGDDMMCTQLMYGTYELMQYTGLKDKNGVEIYEGDIVRSPYRNYTCEISIGESKYIGCGVSLTGVMVKYLNLDKLPEPFMYASGRYDWEVIGNRFANPELLDE